jgi:NADP-dependent aldehyde dehydrogenase
MGPLSDLRRMRIPLGPVAVFGSSNFPFAFSVPGGDTASALAAGCPVVIKAHPAHPATSQATFDALVRAAQSVSAPEGLLSLVFGFEAGKALVEDPAITAVGFTGSGAAGRALWSKANARSTPIPFYGELGAANPLVVTKRACAERASAIGAGIAGSMTLGVGQFCTKPGLLLIPEGDSGDELVAATRDALSELSPMTMLSPSIAQHFREGSSVMASIEGAHFLSGDETGSGTHVSAQLFEVDADVFMEPSSQALREECFGPLALVVRYTTNEELAHVIASIEPSLTFSVFGSDGDSDAVWLVALGSTKAGRVTFNEYPTGVGVSWSMQHGGPWPSTTSPSTTSVGASGIERWLRPVTFQGTPQGLLPSVLRDDNPQGVPQRIDGVAL